MAPAQQSRTATRIFLLACFILPIALLFFTHPFLKLPYDPWEHLIKIRSIYDTGNCFLFWPENPSSFCTWHWSWASLFSIAGIDDTLLWASIIHYTQFIFALICIYYFCHTAIRMAVPDAAGSEVSLPALLATLFWLVGNGTYSIEYQQAWIMWYSVTYQGATIPLFWLISALALKLFLLPGNHLLRKIAYAFSISIGFLLILAYHPSEAVYFLLFFFLLLLATPLISVRKKVLFICSILIAGVIALYFSKLYVHIPLLRSLVRGVEFTNIIQQISLAGEKITDHGLNRLTNSFSELAIVASAAAFIYWLVLVLIARPKLNPTVTVLVLATCLILLIPINKWLSGLVGLILHENIVWRFFFASPWFVMLPIIFVSITKNTNNTALYSSVPLTLILAAAIIASHQIFHGVLYGNVSSLLRSFDKEKVGVQYSDRTIADLEDTIRKQTNTLKKDETILYLRGDMATLARALFGYYAYSHRRVSIPMHTFESSGLDKKYEIAPVELPLNFPKDNHIFNYFNLDKKQISEEIDRSFVVDVPLRFTVESADAGGELLWIKGWAFLKGHFGESDVFVVLKSDSDIHVFDTSNRFRADVAQHFKTEKLENTGFLATIRINDLRPAEYEIGLIVDQDGSSGAAMSESKISLLR